VKCEANTLSLLPFGFPIPVGWRDDTCPDAQFGDTHVRLRFVPTVEANGQLTIADATVTLEATIDVSPPEFLDSYFEEGFESSLRDTLLSNDFKSFFGSVITRLLEAQRGKAIDKVLSLSIDVTGIYAEVPR
jgi:hypothetical protein